MKKGQFKFQDFVDEQRAGLVHGVFIDDTGSPGLNNTPENLHPERKSWVAVIVPKEQIAEVWQQFPEALAELHDLIGAKEFHFTDIYMGRKDFKNVELPKRLAIFQFFTSIFRRYQFPIIVQTLDPESHADIRKQGQFVDKIGPLNLTKHEEFALFMLLINVKRYIEQKFPDTERLTRVFVDEGYKKNGAAIQIPSLKNIFADGLICFGRSDTILPIQLADFAAFCLNRTQLIIGKKDLSKLHDRDLQFLQIIQSIAWNYQNIPKINLKEWFPVDDNPPEKH